MAKHWLPFEPPQRGVPRPSGGRGPLVPARLLGPLRAFWAVLLAVFALVTLTTLASLTETTWAQSPQTPPEFVVSKTELSLGEGRTATYKIRLASAPTGGDSVTVALENSNPAAATLNTESLTFTAGDWFLPQIITVSGVQDDVANTPPLTTTITHRASGGGYDDVLAEVAVRLRDDDSTGLALSTTAIDIFPRGAGDQEDEASTYTIALTSQPTGVVTVELRVAQAFAALSASSLTFDPDNWHIPQKVRVSWPEHSSADAHNNSTQISHYASGGGYGVSAYVDVTVVVRGVSLAISTPTLFIDEGDTGIYTVALTHSPPVGQFVRVDVASESPIATVTPNTLTFHHNSWNNPHIVRVQAVQNDIAHSRPQTTKITHTATGGLYNATGEVQVVIENDDTKEIVLSRAGIAVREAHSPADPSYYISLSSAPPEGDTIDVRIQSDNNLIKPSTTYFSFNRRDWNKPKGVYVITGNSIPLPRISATFTHTASRGGYDGVKATLRATAVDKDELRVVLPSRVTIDARTGGSYGISLSKRPDADTVAVTIESPKPNAIKISVPGSEPSNRRVLSFTQDNWFRPQIVTLVPQPGISGESYTITHTAYGALDLAAHSDNMEVKVTNLASRSPGPDPNKPPIVLNRISQTITSYEGRTGTYLIKLPSQPPSGYSTYVRIQPSDPSLVRIYTDERTRRSVEIFQFDAGNWNTWRRVRYISTNDDIVQDQPRKVTISHTSFSTKRGSAEILEPYGAVELPLVIVDDEARGLVMQPPSLTLEEGNIARYTIRLRAQPPENDPVTIGISSPDSSIAVASPARLTFNRSNWNIPQTVVVTAIDEPSTSNDRSTRLVHTASGGGYDLVAYKHVQVTNHGRRLVLSRKYVDLVEGDAGEYVERRYRVSLGEPPAGRVNVRVSIDDPEVAEISKDQQTFASEHTLAFNNSNWDTPQIIYVRTMGDDVANEKIRRATITHRATGSGYNDTATLGVRVTDTDEAGILIYPSSLRMPEGKDNSLTYGVSLTSAPKRGQTVTLRPVLTAVDGRLPARAYPETLTFTADNWRQEQKVTLVNNIEEDDIAYDPPLSYQITYRADNSGGYKDVEASVQVVIAENDTKGIRSTIRSGTLLEGSVQQHCVWINSEPPSPVRVRLSFGGANPKAFGVREELNDEPKDGLTIWRFTKNDWKVGRCVVINAYDDEHDNRPFSTATLIHSATGGGYDGLTHVIPLRALDDDKRGLDVHVDPTHRGDNVPFPSFQNPRLPYYNTFRNSPDSSLAIPEGGQSWFEVALTSKPFGQTRVDIDFLTCGVPLGNYTLSRDHLIFNEDNWRRPQRVTINVKDESVLVRRACEDDVAFFLRTSGGGYDDYSTTDAPAREVFVTVVVQDNENTPFGFRLPNLVWEGQTIQHRFPHLIGRDGGNEAAQPPPGNPYVITAQSSDPNITVTPARREVTRLVPDTNTYFNVSSVNDDIATGRTHAMITYTITGGHLPSPSVVRVNMRAPDDDRGEVEWHGAAAHWANNSPVFRVPEGGTSRQHLRLTSAPPEGEEVVLTITSDNTTNWRVEPETLTFDANNWNRWQPIVIHALDDNVAYHRYEYRSTQGDFTIRANDGGAYDGYSTGFFTSMYGDNDRKGIRLSRSLLGIDEGGETTYQVSLNSAPESGSRITITLTSSDMAVAQLIDARGNEVSTLDLVFDDSNWNIGKDVKVSTPDNDVANDPPATATITHRASGGRYGAHSLFSRRFDAIQRVLPVQAIDNETKGIFLSERSMSFVEGEVKSYTVRLNTAPPEGAQITVTLGLDAAVAALDQDTLTFTADNWNREQTITVTSIDDDVIHDPPRAAIITHQGMNAGYDGISKDLAISVSDDDAGIVLSESVLNVTEGASGQKSYFVWLKSKPPGDVTVSLSVDDTNVATLSADTLTFTPDGWNTRQRITVTGVDDAISHDLPRRTLITHTAAGPGGYDAAIEQIVDVIVVDDEGKGIMLSPTSLNVEEGGSVTYDVVLRSQPTANVSISLSSTDTDIGTLTNSEDSEVDTLTFTPDNWNTVQTLTFTSNDDDVVNPLSAVITHRATGGGYDSIAEEVSISVIDNDNRGLFISKPALELTEGGTIQDTYEVRLISEPTGPVSVALSVSDEGVVNKLVDSEGNEVTALTFTPGNWKDPQQVTVHGIDDDTAHRPRRTTSILHMASGGGYDASITGSVRITVVDDESLGIAPTPESLELQEGGEAGSYEVVLTSKPTADVTIALSVPSAIATLDKSSLTFTPGTWKDTQTVMVSTIDDDVAHDAPLIADITHRATGGGYGGISKALPLTVVEDDRKGIVLDPAAVTLAEGGEPDTYNVALTSAPPSGEEVVVSLAFDGAVVALVDPQQASLTFDADSWENGVDVEVKALDDPVAQGADRVVKVVHSATGGGYGGVADQALTLTITDDATDKEGVMLTGLDVGDSLSVGEGLERPYQVALTSKPTGTVMVSLRLTDNNPPAAVKLVDVKNANALVDSLQLTFTPGDWSTAQAVKVMGLNDEIDAPDRSAAIIHRASGAGYKGQPEHRLSVSVLDDDTAGLKLDKTSLSLTEGGDIDSYRVELASEPTADVTVSLSSDVAGALGLYQGEGEDTDVKAGATPTLDLTFTPSNWDTAQKVSVRALDDPIAQGGRDVIITHKVKEDHYNAPDRTVDVSLTDNDRKGIVLDPAAVTLAEGGEPDTYNVALRSAPPSGEEVVVSLAFDGAVVALVDPQQASLTFDADSWE
ncbi:MAG: hypothetical protein GDA40_08955, partial [Rhodobacteraceae bacterium]|nr:hypothetical protein [Paracoccaceae bacterium]